MQEQLKKIIMNLTKKQQPVAVCTVCGAYGNSIQYIDARCNKPIGGNRCNGVRARATSKVGWTECSKCNATGRFGQEECLKCFGRGWFFQAPKGEENSIKLLKDSL